MAPTATEAFALLVVSAALVAVTVWVPAWVGALYRPEALIVPTEEFPAATPSTDHVTALFVVFSTVAVNCVVVLTATLTEVGFSETLTGGEGGGLALFIPPQPTNVKAIAKLRKHPEILPDVMTFIGFRKNQGIDGIRAAAVAALEIDRRDSLEGPVAEYSVESKDLR
jgi:hypothetical protein